MSELMLPCFVCKLQVAVALFVSTCRAVLWCCVAIELSEHAAFSWRQNKGKCCLEVEVDEARPLGRPAFPGRPSTQFLGPASNQAYVRCPASKPSCSSSSTTTIDDCNLASLYKNCSQVFSLTALSS